ncbi:MAG TPA: glycosyltransferase family 2 protein [Candidatus Methanoperedens sp.]|nr:glycosyltransferase family 2 protein [Candidatus Methanoperedens sp.]
MGAAEGLSVVVPLFNEAATLDELYRRLRAALPESEIVFVDDGSTDGSAVVLGRIAHADPAARLVRLAGNFGKTAALAAGLSVAREAWVAVLDADLQNAPEDLPLLHAKALEGYDAVIGWRRRRRDPFLTKRLPSRVANRLITAVTGAPVHDCGCGIAVFRRIPLADLPLSGNMHRLLPVHLHARGARVTELEVRHFPRRHGRSHYGLERTYQVLIDLLVAGLLARSVRHPLWLFGGAGLLTLLAALGAGAYGFSRDSGAALAAALILAILSLPPFLLGTLAEAAVRAAPGSRAVKTYAVAETVNC